MEATPYFSTYCLGFLSSWVYQQRYKEMECWCQGRFFFFQGRFYLKEIVLVTNSKTMSRGPGEVLRYPADPSVAHPGWKLLETTTREGRGRWGRAGHNCPLRVLQRALGTYHHDWGWGEMWGGVYRHRPTLKFTSCTMSVHLEISKPQFPQL